MGNVPDEYEENVHPNRTWIENVDDVDDMVASLYQEFRWVLTTGLISIFMMIVF